MKRISPVSADWAERPFVEYVSEVDRLLYARYGITADDLDGVAAAQEAGDSPEVYVAWLAEHYDLCPLPSVGTIGGMVC